MKLTTDRVFNRLLCSARGLLGATSGSWREEWFARDILPVVKDLLRDDHSLTIRDSSASGDDARTTLGVEHGYNSGYVLLAVAAAYYAMCIATSLRSAVTARVKFVKYFEESGLSVWITANGGWEAIARFANPDDYYRCTIP